MRFKIERDPENPPNRRELVAFWIGAHWPWIVAFGVGGFLGWLARNVDR